MKVFAAQLQTAYKFQITAINHTVKSKKQNEKKKNSSRT